MEQSPCSISGGQEWLHFDAASAAASLAVVHALAEVEALEVNDVPSNECC